MSTESGEDQIPLTLGVVAPDAGETIRSQFHSDRQGLPLLFRGLALEARHLLCNPHQVFHVMAHLMRDHIGLSEVVGRAEAVGHLVEEGEVQIHVVIVGAVEGTDCRRRGPAGRLDCADEEYKSRIFILRPKELLPGGFRVGEDNPGEFSQLVVGRSGRCRLGGNRRFRHALHAVEHVDEGQGLMPVK